jgi:D-arabinose 1-dehydrogenase-like Zn-dependent alcohol dehydrogenase
LLHRVIDMYTEGKIRPIQSMTTFGATEIEQAFRHLQKGDHIGKAVVRMPEDGIEILSLASSSPTTFDPAASYLLTGGLGGLGKSIVTWMAERGARNFVFLSRSAGKTDSDRKFIAELKSMGCTAVTVAGKADHMDDVELAVASAPSPIRGIFHMAMALRVRSSSFLLVRRGDEPANGTLGHASRRHDIRRLELRRCAQGGWRVEPSPRFRVVGPGA